MANIKLTASIALRIFGEPYGSLKRGISLAVVPRVLRVAGDSLSGGASSVAVPRILRVSGASLSRVVSLTTTSRIQANASNIVSARYAIVALARMLESDGSTITVGCT